MAKFGVGDKVTMINDYGCKWPGKTILTVEETNYGTAYKIEPTDSPWFAVPERNLHLEKEA
jgi:hypothetical protein